MIYTDYQKYMTDECDPTTPWLNSIVPKVNSGTCLVYTMPIYSKFRNKLSKIILGYVKRHIAIYIKGVINNLSIFLILIFQ